MADVKCKFCRIKYNSTERSCEASENGYHLWRDEDECIGCHGTGIVRHVHPDKPPTIENCPAHYPVTATDINESYKKARQKQNSTDTSLSLLVIDLGNVTLVKAEKGDGTFKIGSVTYSCPEGEFQTVQSYDFPAVRDAIDSQDKPVPRIERADVSGNERYRVVWNDSAYPIPVNVLDALSGVVGKPLPICEPTEGKWTLLKGSEIPGIAMYRYTRGGE